MSQLGRGGRRPTPSPDTALWALYEQRRSQLRTAARPRSRARTWRWSTRTVRHARRWGTAQDQVEGARAGPRRAGEEHAPALRIQALRKTYDGLVALDGVDLEVAPGEIVGLLGHNGAGKTTLVSIVAGLRRADAGQVHVAGIDIERDPVAARRRLGLAPQETGVYPDVTVEDNLRVFGALAGLGRRELVHRVDGVVEAFGLTPLLSRRVGELSGGQRRRVHTAAAVLHRPPLLLLDEPTVGADVGTRDALLHLVRELADEGAGVCYSTHYLPEVEALDASVAVLHRGRMLARGSISELIATHATSAVELTFDGAPPTLPGAQVDGEVARIPARDPARAAAELLTQLPSDTRARLRSIELTRDDLDGAYRSLIAGADAERHADPMEVAA